MSENNEQVLARARTLLAQGDFDAAREVLAAARKAADRKSAELFAFSGELSSLMSDYGQAALEFAKAASLIQESDPILHREYTDKRAAALADLAQVEADRAAAKCLSSE